MVEKIKVAFPDDLYAMHLKTINDIYITPREIDIIACLVRGRKTCKIASLLSIGTKNVENRIAVIKSKLRCGSQEGIRDYIEKSGKFAFIDQYYISLQAKIEFERELKKISGLVKQTPGCCMVIYDREQKDKIYIVHQLKKHLQMAGIKILEVKQNYQTIPQLINESEYSNDISHIICCISQSFIEKKPNVSSFIPSKEKPNSVILISLDKTPITSIIQEFSDQIQCVDLTEQENYYFLIFDILKKVFATIPLDENILFFIKQCKTLSNNSYSTSQEIESLVPNHNVPKVENSGSFSTGNTKILLKQKFILLFTATFLILLFFLFYYRDQLIGLWQSKMHQFVSLAPNIKTWNIPKQFHIFIGRQKLLDNLDSQLHEREPIIQNIFNKNQDTNTVAISACAGLGGIGKTQLALQYVHHTKYPYSIKAWFSAENIGNLKQQYIEFARTLGYNEKKISFNGAFLYIKDWLSKHPDWLLIYDNVNSFQEIETFLPEGKGSIIITTRKRNWPNRFKILDIDIMTENESIELIKSLIRRNIMNNEQGDVKKLVKILGYLPLALAQAGAYIRQNHVTISEYLSLYKIYEMELLANNTFTEENNVYPIAITWNISLKAILSEIEKNHEPPIAIELLTVCAYLAPEKIYKQVLFAWQKRAYPNLVSPELVLNRHIGLLWEYSMINYSEDYISIHRLVQTVLRHQLQNGFEGKNSICSTLDLKWFEALLRFFMDNESDFKLSNSFNQLLETREQFISKFKNCYNDNLAELDLIVSDIYFNQEKYEDFLKLLSKVDDYLKEKHGLEVLKCKLLYLYSAYFRKSGDFNKAEMYIDKAIILLENSKENKTIKPKYLMHLKAKILFNKANLCFAKNKKTEQINRNQAEIETSIKLIKEAISIFNEIHDKRDWLRTIELYGRLLVLANKGNEVINEFKQYNELIEKVADDRTKMLFYLTYSDGYRISENYENALVYCNKAREKAEKLMLKNELLNIQNKEKEINAAYQVQLNNKS